MNIISKSSLNASEISSVNELITRCSLLENIDGCMFLEPELNEFEDFPCFALAYEENILIGVLSVFIIDSANCELYSYVHPDYRRMGCFSTMLTQVKESISLYHISHINIVCEPESTGIQVLNHYSITNYTAEYLMKYTDESAAINCDGFEIFTDDDEFYELVCDDKVLGHCYVDCNDGSTTLYDVEIYSEYRGNGYANILIKLVLEEIDTNNNIILHVTGSNIRALRTYERNGFKVAKEIRYYEFK